MGWYTDPSSQTTTIFDNVNPVLFRNAPSGSAIATTYWSNSSGLGDADIAFWDGAFRFFYRRERLLERVLHRRYRRPRVRPCARARALRFSQCDETSACNTRNRMLDVDDISGVEALYAPALTPPLAPTGVRIVR